MAMYSGRATDAVRVARFIKTLAASAIDIGVFLHLYVYCGMFCGCNRVGDLEDLSKVQN
jgi:hypothetical protein